MLLASCLEKLNMDGLFLLILLALAGFTFTRLFTTSKNIRDARYQLELEVPVLRQIGLDTFIDIFNKKHIVFYHPDFKYLEAHNDIDGRIRKSKQYPWYDDTHITHYNFNQAAEELLLGRYGELEICVNIASLELPRLTGKLTRNAQRIMRENGLSATDDLSVPLVLIFGNNKEALTLALESGMHPAIIAEIIYTHKLSSEEAISMLEEAKLYSELPSKWIENLYAINYDKQSINS